MMFPIGSVGEYCPDVIAGQFRVFHQDLLGGHPGSQPAQDVVHGNPHAANAGATATLSRLEGDKITVIQGRCAHGNTGVGVRQRADPKGSAGSTRFRSWGEQRIIRHPSRPRLTEQRRIQGGKLEGVAFGQRHQVRVGSVL